MQVGVSIVQPDNTRLLPRGGGADIRDSISIWLAAENCTELCYFGMMFGGVGRFWYELPVYTGYYTPYYLKCIEASGAAPLNGLRIQRASQFNTLDIVPTIPQMNVTDWKACLRMLF